MADDKTLIKTKDKGRAVDPPTTPTEQFVPCVVVVEGPRRGSHFLLEETNNRIGRSTNNTIVFEDHSVSRNHAVISTSASQWMVSDLGSKNGTIVNNQLIKEAVTIGHKDVIQIGIYALRLITQKVSIEEEMEKIPWDTDVAIVEEPISRGETARVDASGGPVDESSSVEEGNDDDENLEVDDIQGMNISEDNEENPDEQGVGSVIKGKLGRRLVWLFVALIVVVGGAVYGYLEWMAPQQESKPAEPMHEMPTSEEIAPDSADLPRDEALQPPQPLMAPEPGNEPVAPPTAREEPESIRLVPVFLDFAASPLPAKVEFEGKDYGQTPVKINVELQIGQSYTANGTFALGEFQDSYTEHVTFTVAENQGMVPVLFRAPIGVIKITSLPLNTKVYLEGYFVYDQFHAKTAKLSEVTFNKPVYAPYGRYIVELRQPKQIGDNQFVEDIRYRREFFITEDKPAFNLTLAGEDLTSFPIEVRSIPENADVFVDASPMGKTPYVGNFPLGKHQLTLKKDGYFEHTESIEMDINTPYRVDVTLKTTEAGERINAGRQLLRNGQYKEAIAKFSEVFEHVPTISEIAQSQYLLGTCFVYLEDTKTAKGYFEQAKEHPDYQYQAMLGLASVYHAEGDVGKALPLLVEVMLKEKEGEVAADAKALLKQISPLRAVLYVYSEPTGATVSVNDENVGQPTPVILHDLGLGNYKIHIEKKGYIPQDLSLNLTANEFNPVYVKLRPIQQ